MEILKPDLMVTSLADINLQEFRQKEMRGIIIDLDNTISPWKANYISAEADCFLREALALGYQVCLLTNARKKRSEKLVRKYSIHCLPFALKPRKRAFLKALALMGLPAHQVLVIGDQVFTDVLGGNRAGCFTVLVPALSKKEFVGTKVMRLFENLVKTDITYRK
ncbi:MAG TPA: YqeG family HAD IIIA-type phosphatase [Peptococcaceae bacterium]|jgi:HAD superfamily phosphatase (TIGR01668 family)|nr:YqeG family HAD IIIA-type phosphatase [Clostridia bacterium]HOB81535.1 YqeG family HAD IIIA-type phosphatase [Peptococcaceae bacterium]HQD53623.1 YqeG family HAD IIIA-type phosphatase [Peptococcaceae bacterium]